jgi:hypothetical protein
MCKNNLTRKKEKDVRLFMKRFCEKKNMKILNKYTCTIKQLILKETISITLIIYIYIMAIKVYLVVL